MVSAASQGDRFEYGYTTGGITLDLFESNTLSIHEMFFMNSNSQVDSTFQYNNTQDSMSERYIYNSSKQLIKLIEYDYSKAGSTVGNITNYTYDGRGNVITEADNYCKQRMSIILIYRLTLTWEYIYYSPVRTWLKLLQFLMVQEHRF